MKFLVFIKHVPVSSEIHFDREKKTLIREGVKCEINAYDRRAITEAIRYRSEQGGEVVAATMGPQQAKDALREALIMGVDSCVHISDPRLAGSDTLVTARVLAAAAKKIGYDIIFCGQHSTDSETGQVPVELAEFLNLPCAAAVRKIEYLPNRSIQVTSETEEGSLLMEMHLPAVITTAERLIKPLKTKNADLTTAPDEKIHEAGLTELGVSDDDVGLKASPTWVADIIDVSMTRSTEIWDGSDVPATAARILKMIRSRKKRSGSVRPAAIPARQQESTDNLFWCWIELLQGQVRPVSLEILSTSAFLAAEKKGMVCAIITGPLTSDVSNLLATRGADRIIHLTGNSVHPDQIVTLLSERIEMEKPYALFFPASTQGRYLAPRIAARMGLGLTGDCVGLKITKDGHLAQLKPAFGGNIVAPIYSRTYPQMATIRPGALDTGIPRKAAEPEVIQWTLPDLVSPQFTIIAQEIDSGIEALKLDDAKIVIGIGVGMGQENVRVAHRLADLLGGAIGATRRVVDNGWVPRQFQVGLTGKFITPEIYLGLGVSGRYNHMVGVQKSGIIIAVNQDPDAEIFRASDIGVHGDCVAIAAELVRVLETSKE